MAKFILRRLLWVIPVLRGVVLIVFTIDRVGPGDPVAAALGGTYTQEQYDALFQSMADGTLVVDNNSDPDTKPETTNVTVDYQ